MASQAKQSAELALSELRMMIRSARPVIRIAGVSGALAVALGAYGAHGSRPFLVCLVGQS